MADKYRYIELKKLKLDCNYDSTERYEYNLKNKRIKRFRVSLENCENLPFVGMNNLQIKKLIVGYEPKKDIKNLSTIQDSTYFSESIIPFDKKLKKDGKKVESKDKYLTSILNADLFCDYKNTDVDSVMYEKFYKESDNVDFFRGKKYRVNLNNCETSIPSGNDKLINIIIDSLSLEYIPEKDKIIINDELNKDDKIDILKTRKNTIVNMIKNETNEIKKKNLQTQIKLYDEQIKLVSDSMKVKIDEK